MRIAVPVGSFALLTQAERVTYWLNKLGYQAEVIPLDRYPQAFLNKDYDFFFCIVQGPEVDFLMTNKKMYVKTLANTAFWFFSSFLCYKAPDIKMLARHIGSSGGWCFFAQYHDLISTLGSSARVSWLPPCTDTSLYSEKSKLEQLYDVSFPCDEQTTIFDTVCKNLDSFKVTSPDLDKPDEVIASLEMSKMSVHVPDGFFGRYDMLPSVLDSLSYGRTVITNRSESLTKMFVSSAYIKTYGFLEEISALLVNSLQDKDFLAQGVEARRYVQRNADYALRMRQAINVLESNDMDIEWIDIYHRLSQ